MRVDVFTEIKNKDTNKDGGGKGQWTAWKAAKLGKEYEKHGGDYENEAGSKNEPKKGTPEPKSGGKQEKEVKEGGQNGEVENKKDDQKDDRAEKEQPAKKSRSKAKVSPSSRTYS